MSPENRTKSPLGPLPRRRAWVTGGSIASLALVLSGIASPAIATAESVKANAGTTIAARAGRRNDRSRPRSEGSARAGGAEGPHGSDGSDRSHGSDGSDGSHGSDRSSRTDGLDGATGATATPVRRVRATTSTRYNPLVVAPVVTTHQFSAALIDGVAFAGIRTVPGGVYDWENISNTGDTFPDGRLRHLGVQQRDADHGLGPGVDRGRRGVGDHLHLTFVSPGPPPVAVPSFACTEVWTQQVTPALVLRSAIDQSDVKGVIPSVKGKKFS